MPIFFDDFKCPSSNELPAAAAFDRLHGKRDAALLERSGAVPSARCLSDASRVTLTMGSKADKECLI